MDRYQMNAPTDWSRGYPIRESYPARWHHFQSPAHLRAICAVMGVAWDVGPETPLSIAEVGCGTGYTAQMLAAGNPRWQVVGLDYNPAHIAQARSVAAAAGLENLRFLEADLAELGDSALEQLPEFDLITVHGVWSWVGDAVRDGILRLLRRRLKAGGLALISYNALPGAGGSLGLARLVRPSMQHAGSGIGAVEHASKLVQRLLATEPQHVPVSAWRGMFSGEVSGAKASYLLHEFQTEHWRPCFHADVASAMESAQCQYVGSATIDENFPSMSLSDAQIELWQEAPNAAERELIFDLCVPRMFRRDLYVRGLRRVSRVTELNALWFALITHRPGAASLSAQAGLVQLPQPLVDAVRGALVHAPQSIGALRALPGCNKATPEELVAFLMGSGLAMPVWRQPGSGTDWPQAVAAARRLNAVAAGELAPFGGSGQLGLATPVLGGGLPVPALELIVAQLLAQSTGEPAATEDAGALMRRILPKGQTPSPEVCAELESAIAALLAERRSVWRALDIA
jgi:SAM-dependent methyltransferase